MERTQFTFYESFYKAISRIKKKPDQAIAYNAIIRLALYGEEPNLDELPDIVAVALENIIPNIIASNKKAANGKLGGIKQTASKAEAKPKQTASENEKENEIGIELKKDKKEKTSKHRYGRYKNVLLTDDQLDTLKAEFCDWEARIERLSEYIAAKGDKYKNHLAVIRTWAKKDQPASAPRPAPITGTDEIRRLLEVM